MQIATLDLDFVRRQAHAEILDHQGVRAWSLPAELQAEIITTCGNLEGLAPDNCRLRGPQRQLVLERDGRSSIVEGPAFEALVPATLAPVARLLMEWVRAQGPPRADEPDDAPRNGDFWNSIYETEGGPWDLGEASPPLERLLASVPLPPGGGDAVVLGCGRGHDVRAAARVGWRAAGIDFAPRAIADARSISERQGIDTRFIEADLFHLPADIGSFDVVLEHTCFCAIDPASRPLYVASVEKLLRPGGLLVGVFYHHGREGGPPFDTSPDDLRGQFQPNFEVRHLAPVTDSPLHRTGSEIEAIFRLR